MSFQSLLEKTADIYEITNNVDEFGTAIPFQSVVHAGVACRLVQLSEGESIQGGTERARGSHKVFFLGDISDLTEKHFLVIDETRYDITYVNRVHAQTLAVHHLEVYCQEDVDSRTDEDGYTYFIWEQPRRLQEDIWVSENNEIMTMED